MTLGEQIKEAREMKNMSQEELAEKLSCSRQAVSKWENNTSVPQGVNRELLEQVLEIDFEHNKEKTESIGKAMTWQKAVVTWLGWITTAILLIILIVVGIAVGSKYFGPDVSDSYLSEVKSGSDEISESNLNGAEIKEPTITKITFYDEEQNEVKDEALWYNAANVDSILIQWTNGVPNDIKIFFTPSGTETLDETELLLTLPVMDGDMVQLINADVLKNISQGDIYFELNFGTGIITSDLYNFFYMDDTLEEVQSTTLVYVDAFNGNSLKYDVVEWIEVPGSRATELGITDDEAPNGFYIYNEEMLSKELPISENIIYSIIGMGNGDLTHLEVTKEEMAAFFEERRNEEAELEMRYPYHLTIENGEIVIIEEQYIP